MRLVLILGLLMTLSASADAATARDSRTHHVIIRPGIASSFAAVPVPPGRYKFSGYPPIPPEANSVGGWINGGGAP
jgi:hypothetical protein